MALFADMSAPSESLILSGTVDNAIRIGEYLIPHAKAAFAEMGPMKSSSRQKRSYGGSNIKVPATSLSASCIRL